MDTEFYPEKANALAIALGLKERSAVELFYENPCSWTFPKIPKAEQTPEMVRLAVEKDAFSIRYVAENLLTSELCKMAVKQDAKCLRDIPADYKTASLYEAAVEQDASAIEFVPKRLYTESMGKYAVSQDGMLLKYVPREQLTKELCDIAIDQTALAIRFVPKHFITSEMAWKAISQHIEIPRKQENDLYYIAPSFPIWYIPSEVITEEMVRASVAYNPKSIQDIPDGYLTRDLYLMAVEKDGLALEFVQYKYKDKELITAAIIADPLALEFLSESKRTKKLCMAAFEANPFALRWIPEKYVTRKMCLKAIESIDPQYPVRDFHLYWFPDNWQNDKTLIDAMCDKIGVSILLEDIRKYSLNPETMDYIKNILSKEQEKYFEPLLADELETPEPKEDTILVKMDNSDVHTYALAETDSEAEIRSIYYISDIHLEHQLKAVLENLQINSAKINDFMDEKIHEMLSGVEGQDNYLLIAGDTGHTEELVLRFYWKLSKTWKGTIICILGNHEIWDFHYTKRGKPRAFRELDVIVADYHRRVNMIDNAFLLQNELFINYKNQIKRTISEEQILNASDEDLSAVLEQSSLIVLGGIGFSGLNPKYNAEHLLYDVTITTMEEDRAQSARFKQLYDKVKRCAGEQQVIVLTHTPVRDWSSETQPYHPNWVYINGHTHTNTIIRAKDGTTVLSDNQIGKKPTKWKLNAFTVAGWYDPFRDRGDGIYEITSEQYKDFNCGRGVKSNGCNRKGRIYMLKRSGYYMFLFQSKTSLYLLSGGIINRLDNTIQYYYDHMEMYIQRVKTALAPYQNALCKLGEEVQKIGGWGKIHGCIVDINFCNHLYLNPYDGKITPYFAIKPYDIESRTEYPDLLSLLQDQIPYLCKKFTDAQNSGMIPILSKYAVGNAESTVLATVPEIVLGTEMYKPSRRMRAIQYLFDGNVIRVWKDAVLSSRFGSQSNVLEMTDHQVD